MIPKDVREELALDEGSGFWVFSVEGEGILLKKIEQRTLTEEDPSVREILDKKDKLNISQKNVLRAMKKYRSNGKLEEL